MPRKNRRFDLNLLPMLDALLELRSVTQAGRAFNMTQPAASGALAKLRIIFDDDLLVPVGREMRLTPKAERIQASVHHLLDLLDETFESHDADPRSWSGELILATTDAVVLHILPKMLLRIQSAAPKITVRITNFTRSSVSNLRGEEIDLIIAPPQIVNDDALMSRRIYRDRFVVLHSKDHPPGSGTLDEYMQRAHITTVIDAPQIGGEPRSHFSAELDTLRSTQHNQAVMPYYSLLPLLIADTSLLALVQESLAKRFMKILPVAYVDPPTALPALDLHMFWSPRVNEDPRHTWLRNVIAEVSKQEE